MKDSELHHLEEELVNLLSSYRDACKEFDIDFDDNLQDLIDRSGE
jgi:hypothetical protein